MQNVTKKVLKSFIVCFIAFNVYNQSQAGVGEVIGSVIEASKSMAKKTIEESTRLAKKTFTESKKLAVAICSKTMVVLLAISKSMYEGSCRLLNAAVVKPFQQVLDFTLKMCEKIFRGIQKIIMFVVESKLFRSIVSNIIGALNNIFQFSKELCLKSLEKMYEYLINPLLNLAKWCFNHMVSMAGAILDYVIKPFFSFLWNIIVGSIRYGAKGLVALYEHVIDPMICFISWCVKGALECGENIARVILVRVIEPFFNFLGHMIKYGVIYGVKFLEHLWEYVIKPMLRPIKWCLSNIAYYGIKMGEALLEYVVIPLFKFLGNVIVNLVEAGVKLFVKIWEHAIEPVLSFIGQCAEYIFEKAKYAIELFTRALIEVTKYIVNCVELFAEFVRNAIITSFDNVIIPTLRFIYKSGSFVLRQAWNTILFAIGFVPFVLHKLYKMIIKEEDNFEIIDRPTG
ncbi:hypothetical protein ACFLYA_01065 [Candidatus Dependentiae bacterium]